MTIDITPFTSLRSVTVLAERSRQKLESVTGEIASGVRHSDLSGFSSEGSLQNILFFDNAIDAANGYIHSNNNALSKIDVFEASVDSLQNIAEELSTLIVTRMNGASGDNIPVENIVSGLLDRTATALNATFGGQYLFGGSKTDRPPVINISQSNVTDNIAHASYYQGDSDAQTVQSGPGQEVTYGITANQEAFRHLIGASHLLLEAHATGDDKTFEKALDLVNRSVSGIASVNGNLRKDANSLEETNRAQEEIKIVLEKNISDLRDTNIVEASTRLAELEAMVQASYNAWARLSSLRLSDFLR